MKIYIRHFYSKNYHLTLMKIHWPKSNKVRKKTPFIQTKENKTLCAKQT